MPAMRRPHARRRACVAVVVALLVLPTADARAADRTVLAIGAHAGDAEVTAGAILARHKRLGDRVVMLHLTLGEGGNPKMSPAAYGEQKKREALVAARVLGAEALFGPWKDGESGNEGGETRAGAWAEHDPDSSPAGCARLGRRWWDPS